MFKALWKYILEYKLIYIVTVIALFIDYAIVIVPTQIIEYVVNQIVERRLTENMLHQQLFYLLIASVVAYIAVYIWVKQLFKRSDYFSHRLRLNLFNKLIAMRANYYAKFTSGDLITRFTNDIEALSTLLGYGSMSILMAFATVLFVLPAMFLISWQISIALTVPIFLCGIFIYVFGKKQEQAVEKTREAVSQLSSEVLEVVDGIRVTRAYGKKELGTQKFQEKTKALRIQSNAIVKIQGLFTRASGIAMAISTITLLLLGSHAIKQGTMTLGQLVALQLYALMLLDPMWMLSDILLVYQSAKIGYKKLDELLETTDDLSQDGQKIVNNFEEVAFHHYDFTYLNASSPSLKQVSVTLKKGQTLGVVGKTGSGKTTFIRQLLMQYPIGRGELLLNGKPITTYQRQSIEKLIGYVPQEHVLFSKNVKDNILIGNSHADIIQIAAAVEAAAFTGDLERMPDGLDTMIGEKGVSISGGQKQRISIARALIKEPDVLILDDSLSAVDAKTERAIIDNMRLVRQNKTNIIVTHRLSAVAQADWIIVFDNGEIVSQGTSDMLLQEKGWYYEQYQRQQIQEVEEYADSV